MKNLYSRLGLVVIFVILLVGGLFVYQLFEKQKSQSPSFMTETKSIVPPTEAQLSAQAIINQAADKSSISKAVWVASGMTELEYNVLWKKGTERPGTSPLNDEKRPGKFITKACGLEVYSSEHKYESGTGWPSFWEVNKDNIILKDDTSWLGIKRTEVLSTCGEHLGHVFEDGPEPTGLRYCMNGAALKFIPDKQ